MKARTLTLPQDILDKISAWEAEIVASGLYFPDTWSLRTKYAAVQSGRTQAQIDEQEQDLVWYRQVRDEQAARRIADDERFEQEWNERLKHEWKKEGFRI